MKQIVLILLVCPVKVNDGVVAYMTVPWRFNTLTLKPTS